MTRRYTPAQIDAIESFRESPYCSMFGCHETEQAAKAVVKWLAANGNRWDAALPQLETITEERYLKHSHALFDEENDYGFVACNFERKFVVDGHVSDEFIEAMHRGTDGMRLNKASLHKLRPDLFENEQHASRRI